MKNIINRLLTIGLFAVVASGTLTSCDYLDQQPENLKTTDKIWQTRSDVEAYLYNVYGYIRRLTDDPTTLGFADETSCVYSNTFVRRMVVGNYGPSENWQDCWGHYYQGIQKALTFEANIDRVPDNIVSADLKNQYKAESRFLRGWFYWNLLRLYGPFVICEKPAELDEDFNTYARVPFDQCVEYICSLMESTYGILPAVWTSNANLGRPTEGAAKAIISQVRLLAASELWNGSETEAPRYKDFKDKNGQLLAPQTYDPHKWELAADAAKDVMDMGIYHLYRNTESGDSEFDPYLSCRELFMNGTHAEIIFASYVSDDDWFYGHDIRCTPGDKGMYMANATQNVVDAFLTAGGYDIHDDDSYTEEGFAQNDDPRHFASIRNEIERGYRKGEHNMYVNREPRFYAFVHYNARPVLSAISADDYNHFSSDGNQDGFGRAEYYLSGKSGATNANVDFTGYNIAKRVSTTSNIRNNQASFRPYIHIRYAEILLNYIEALNECDPTNSDILSYFEEIRSRAGITNPLTRLYPEAVGNKAEMRKWIIRERQIELSFEGDRFWTLQRRLLFEKEENRKIYRMNVLADDGGQGFQFEGFYERKLFQTRFWDNKMYLYPILQSEIDRNHALVQNPGWG